MITKNTKKVINVCTRYGRGWIDWQTARAELIALDVPPDLTAGVLLGTVHIAGA